MYKFLFAILLISSVQVSAQLYVLDMEKYLAPEEIGRVDSMLADFHKRTGKVVLMSTDTLNVRDPLYSNELFRRYFPDTTSSEKVLILLMSRKNQLVQMTASKTLLGKINDQMLLEMIRAGAPSLQAKRREEGVTIILKKAMEAMEKL